MITFDDYLPNTDSTESITRLKKNESLIISSYLVFAIKMMKNKIYKSEKSEKKMSKCIKINAKRQS